MSEEPILGEGGSVFDAEAELRRQEQTLKNISEKFVPVSEERLNKLWAAVRETIDEFTDQLVQFQLDRKAQSETIATLQAEVEGLRQQLIMMTATMPTNHDETVNDLGRRVLELERGKSDR